MAKEVVVDDQASNVEVHLDENNQAIKPETKKEEPKYVTVEQLTQTLEQAIKKATAPIYYEFRKSREVAPQQNQPVAQPKPEPTEWDTKLQKDWKGTVEELAEQRVEKILKAREEAQRVESDRIRNANLLEQNKQAVMSKHTDLADTDSPKNKIYMQVLQEHPEYLNNTYGPILAMRDMEDRLKDMGHVDSTTRQIADKEVARQVRTNGAAIPKGTSNPGAKKSIVLTKEQKEICDANRIPYDKYAQFSAQISNKGGVEA